MGCGIEKGVRWLLALLALLTPAWASRSGESELEAWFWKVGERLQRYPYLWGGNGPGGFDCSGLVVYIYRHLGVSLPRTSRQQYRALPEVKDRVKVGDLLFFSASRKEVDHVAIYIGRGYMLHASGKWGQVVIEPWNALASSYVGARRPFRW